MDISPNEYYRKHGVWPIFETKSNGEKAEDKVRARQIRASERISRSPRSSGSPRFPPKYKSTSPGSHRYQSIPSSPRSTGRKGVGRSSSSFSVPLPSSTLPPVITPSAVSSSKSTSPGSPRYQSIPSSPRRSGRSGSSQSFSVPFSRATTPPSISAPPRSSSPERNSRAASLSRGRYSSTVQLEQQREGMVYPDEPGRIIRPGRSASPSGRELKPPRGSEGRWRDEAPKTVGERRAMNPNCFLDYSDPNHPKYPVCSRGTERVSCAAIVSAKRRAAQYHNEQVLAKAEELNQRYKCTKKVRFEQEKASQGGRRGTSRKG